MERHILLEPYFHNGQTRPFFLSTQILFYTGHIWIFMFTNTSLSHFGNFQLLSGYSRIPSINIAWDGVFVQIRGVVNNIGKYIKSILHMGDKQ